MSINAFVAFWVLFRLFWGCFNVSQNSRDVVLKNTRYPVVLVSVFLFWSVIVCALGDYGAKALYNRRAFVC